MKTTKNQNLLAATLVVVVLFTASVTRLAAQTVGQKVSDASATVTETVQDASKTTADKLDRIWQQIDERRLMHRTRDEMVGWVIMGIVVGSILGRVTKLAWGTAFAFGLIGAVVGGEVAHFTQLDIGLGPVLIRYEDLLCAMIGAVVLLLIMRVVMSKRKPKK